MYGLHNLRGQFSGSQFFIGFWKGYTDVSFFFFIRNNIPDFWGKK